MPNDRDFSDEVANLRGGKIQGSTAGIAPFQRPAKVIVFDLHWIWGQLLHHGLLISILKHTTHSEATQRKPQRVS